MTVSTINKEQNSIQVAIHRLMPKLALSALISTLLLMIMGSIVRVTGHGLGCPDWPLCYGRVIPPAMTGAWVEFSHRFLVAAASLQIIALGVFAWRYYRRQAWLFRSAMAAVGLLIVQITLGGLHVIFEIPPATGLVHTGVAMLIVGLLTVQVVSTQQASLDLTELERELLYNKRFVTWVSITAGATYLLLLTGAYVTRSGASLICPSFPWCGMNIDSWLIDIQMLHRYTAFTIVFLTLGLIVWLITQQNSKRVAFIAYGVGTLLLIQFGLGVANVWLHLPMWARVLHLTVAATFWSSLVLLLSLCFIRQPN